MNHKEYRNLFRSQRPNPLEAQNGSPKWNVSQMVGDLGHYGRYQEAKALAGEDLRRRARYQQCRFPGIQYRLRELRADATRDTNAPLVGDATEGAVLTGVMLCTLIGGAVYVARGGSFDIAAGIFDATAVPIIAAKAAQACLRGRRMRKLREDTVIAGE